MGFSPGEVKGEEPLPPEAPRNPAPQRTKRYDFESRARRAGGLKEFAQQTKESTLVHKLTPPLARPINKSPVHRPLTKPAHSLTQSTNPPPTRKKVSRMISVILPTYNRRDLLLRAIDSVLAQTYTDLECLIIDDGSTDGTESAVRALTDPRVRYIRQDNTGACAARNHGILSAQGDYIAFQDSDDVWHPDKLQKQLDFLVASDASVVACAMIRNGAPFPTHVPRGPVTFDMLLRESLCSTQCLLGRTEVFREVQFDAEMPRLQDWDLLLRITEKYRVCFSPEPLVDVYTQPDSISSQPEKLHQALVRLYGKFHGAITAPQRGTDLALRWMRHIVQSAPEGTNPWTAEMLLIAPDWVCTAPPTGPVVIETDCASDMHALRLCLDIGAFKPEPNRMYLPEALLPAVLKRAEQVLFPGHGERLGGALLALSAWKSHRYAWDMLSGVYGAGAVAAEMAAQCLPDLSAWATALGGIRLPEHTGPVRRIGVYYHSLCNGGVQRVTAALVRLWTDMGLQVTLITAHAADPMDYPIPAGVQRLVIPAFDPADPSANRAHVQALHEAAKALDLLVFNAWADPLILPDVIAVRSTGCRCLIHTHSVFTLPLSEEGLRDRFAVLPEVYALASGVVTLSETDAAYWRYAHPRVYVTVNPLTFDPAQTPVNALHGRTILWAGRLSKEKRPLDAIDIMARVVQRVPDARMILLGGGNDDILAALRRRIDANGLATHVTLPGFQEDTAPFYAKADVFLCTSAYEGFCLTMAEAQTFGIPCVTYALPYLTIMQGGGHVSVPQGDIQAAADALIHLLTDGPERISLGKAARQNVEDRLCIDQRVIWQSILDDMAAPRPPMPAPDAAAVMLSTLRAHAVQASPIGMETSRPTAFVPLPEKGPCKRLRKKAATFLQVLLIEGPNGIWRVLKEKR